MLNILFGFIGTIVGILLTIYIPKLIKRYLSKQPKKYFDITFKLVYTIQSSIFSQNKNDKVTKSNDITIRIKAHNEEDALEIAEGVIHQEVEIELVKIKDLGYNVI